MDRRHCCLHTRLLVNYYFEFANGPGKLDRPMDKNLVVFCLAVQKTGGKGPHCDKIEEDSSGLVRSLKWHKKYFIDPRSGFRIAPTYQN